MQPNRRFAVRCLIALAAARASTALAAGPALQQPAVSPDGREVAFVNAGAIWSVPTAGGDAHPLIADVGDVSRPLYSPDGKRLAFTSSRTGGGDLYVLTLDTGELKRVTYDDGGERLDAWSPDGKLLYFTTGSHEVGGTPDVYKIAVDGGTPMAVVAEPYGGDTCAAPSPDGKTVALAADAGMATSQWWRHGHAHIDCCAIWTTTDGKRFAQQTDDTAKHLWPMWSPDGKTLYYMADADGTETLYAQPVATDATTRPAAKKLTNFHDGRLLWPTIASGDGHTIVFERDFGLYKLDVLSGVASPIPVRLRGAVTASTPSRQTLTREAGETVVSHDGRKVAVVVRGQVFAAAVANPDGPQPAFRVTKTDAIESNVTWSNDDRRLAYTSTRDGPRHVYLYDLVSRTETRLTDGAGNDSEPSFAPDDSALAFVRNGTELRAIDMAAPGGGRRRRRGGGESPTTAPTTAPATGPTTGRASRDRLLAKGLSLPQPPYGDRRTIAWAPAGDYIAIMSSDGRGFRNAYLVPAVGGPARAVSFVANAQSTPVAWMPDGSALLFGTGQRTEDTDLIRVDLKPRTPTFRTDQFRELFRQRPTRPGPEPTSPRQPTGDAEDDTAAPTPTTAPAAPDRVLATLNSTTRPTTGPATRPDHTEVVFDDLDQRVGLLPVGVDVTDVAVSPDGKWAGVLGTSAGRENVYLYPLDPLVENPVPRQVTATVGGKSALQFAPDPVGLGTRLYYREGSQLRYVAVPARAGGGEAEAPTDAAPGRRGRGAPAAAPVEAGPTPGGEVTIPVELEVNFERDKRVAFDQAWRYLGDHFHDPAMHGLNWPAVRARFAPMVEAARTPADARRLMALMIGELNASHCGVTAPREEGAGPAGNVGRMGVTWDAAEYDRTGKLRVATVLPYGPAALVGLKPGQFVATVDSAGTDRPANLDQLLEGKAGKDVTLGVSDDGKAPPHEVRVMLTNGGAERQLAYKAWVSANREYVRKASGGKLGYVHLADMGTPALARLYADLNAKTAGQAGVVVDVRNNNGGFVNGTAIDVFSRRNYISLQPRDQAMTSGRVILGQRYLGLPTVLVTNRQTLSDGEDFTEGYQALGLGDTVGEPTAGWIIFTSAVGLLDGTSIRMPAETVFDHSGGPMEMHPRPVTVLVPKPPGEATAGRDPQLDAAVKDLLGKVK